MRSFAVALVVLTLSGCANTMTSEADALRVPDERITLKTQAAPGLVPVTVVKDSGFIGGICSYPIYVAGKEAAVLRNGEQVTFFLPPGRTPLGALRGCGSGELVEAELLATIGEPARFRVTFSSSGDFKMFRTAF